MAISNGTRVHGQRDTERKPPPVKPTSPTIKGQTDRMHASDKLKKPDAPGSKAPVGPISAANVLYKGGNGKSTGPNPTSKADEWRGASNAVPQKTEATKGAVPAKKIEISDGNQGEHNRKRKAIADNVGDMRGKSSVDSQSALERIGGKKLNPGGRGSNAESDRSASNAKRVLKGMYPSAKG